MTMRALILLTFLCGCSGQPITNPFAEPEVAVVQEALRAARVGDSAAWAKVAGSAEFIGDGAPRRAKLADFVSSCALERFEVRGSEVVASGVCSHSNEPDFGWPYTVTFRLKGDRITAIQPFYSEM
jgi:hypothetical protein